jgi:hypothetical protein
VRLQWATQALAALAPTVRSVNNRSVLQQGDLLLAHARLSTSMALETAPQAPAQCWQRQLNETVARNRCW